MTYPEYSVLTTRFYVRLFDYLGNTLIYCHDRQSAEDVLREFWKKGVRGEIKAEKAI